MKALSSASHYEILEIAPGATPDEVERAYLMARAAFAEGSLALYSVFDSQDAAAIRERTEAAYKVLANSDLRREYDRTFRCDEASDAALESAIPRQVSQDAAVR